MAVSGNASHGGSRPPLYRVAAAIDARCRRAGDPEELAWPSGGAAPSSIRSIRAASSTPATTASATSAGSRRGLDYVASLGVDAIWLSPFFASPMKDFGYDVSDYRDVDPMFGTLADFDALLAEAHARGLKVIIDQVWSHSSDKHPWFVESSASRENPRADWYVWADAKPDGTPPNNWLASFGGPAWTWSAKRRQYYLHNFLPEQPDLNFWNPEVQDAVLDIARFWLDRGVDGFRLDVVNYYFHDRDSDATIRRRSAIARPLMATDMQLHSCDRSQPENLAFINRLRALMDSYGGDA